MTLLLSRYDLRNLIKIYKIYNDNEIIEFINNPDTLTNYDLKKSLILLKNNFDIPIQKMQEFYSKYELFKGGRLKKGVKTKPPPSDKKTKSSGKKKKSSSKKKSSGKKKKTSGKKSKKSKKENEPDMMAMAQMASSTGMLDNVVGLPAAPGAAGPVGSPRSAAPGNVNQPRGPLDINGSNSCQIGKSLIIPIILPPLPPLNNSMHHHGGHQNPYPQVTQYPGYDYLQKYMEHYAALQKQNSSQQSTSSNHTHTNTNPNQNSFAVPSELKLTLNLDKTSGNKSSGPPDQDLQNIVKDLEEQISSKLNSPEVRVQKDLATDLQVSIKEEIKQKLIAEMKQEVKNKIAQYIATNVAEKTPDSISNNQESIFQDTVPPFYTPGIVLP